MPDIPLRALNDDNTLPAIGFGTYPLKDSEPVESALALDRRANATVVATHETVTLSLGRDQVAETLQAYPAVTRQLADAASRRDEATQTVLGRPTLEIDESVLV